MLCENGECQCVGRDGLCDRDVDCCEGDICLVGSCQDGTECVRERQVCDVDNPCCGRLTCLAHYSEQTSYCCVSQGFRCRESSDCCGNMTYNPDTEICEAVSEGNACNTQLDCAEGFSCLPPEGDDTGPRTCRRP